MKTADLKESTGALVTAAKGARFSGHMRPLLDGLSSLESGWDGGGSSGCPEAVGAGPVGISVSGRRNSREGKGVPVFSYLASLAHFHLLS